MFCFLGGRGDGMGVTGKINSIFKEGLSSIIRRTACPPVVSISKFYLACSAVQFLVLYFSLVCQKHKGFKLLCAVTSWLHYTTGSLIFRVNILLIEII